MTTHLRGALCAALVAGVALVGMAPPPLAIAGHGVITGACDTRASQDALFNPCAVLDVSRFEDRR